MRRTTVGLIVTLALSIVVVALATGAPLRAKVPRIGFLSLRSPNATSLYFEVFRQSLREMGYAEGQNIALEYRYAEGKADRLPALAADLVELGVDVIVVADTPAIHAAIQATTTIPIVMSTVGDPVQSGFVKSLARPGGNVTGVGGLITELNGKLLQLLKEAVPGVTRMAVFVTPGGLALHLTEEMEAAARALGVQLQFVQVLGPDEFESAFNAATRKGAGALLLLPAPLFAVNERRIAALALQSRLPAIFWRRQFAEAGGLMAYGPSRSENWRRVAALVGKILKGAKPADLPVEQPVRFELVLNLKSAKALGLTIPPLLLVRADEVIE